MSSLAAAAVSATASGFACRRVEHLSAMERALVDQPLPLPAVLASPSSVFALRTLREHTEAYADGDELRGLFPQTYGQRLVQLVAEAGGSSSESAHMSHRGGGAAARLFGFLNGPAGVYKHEYVELNEENTRAYRNQGGFDMIGSGRDKIETPEQFKGSAAIARELDLDGLVVIGGDDSNTNAAVLAEYFRKEGVRTQVIGVPKTIDGDLRNDMVETSFGFDSATKLYSELIGNLAIDALSARKYYHFVRLMGRSASHITLECGLQTRANITIVGEEVQARNQSLASIVNEVADVVAKRAAAGKNYGIVLVPEGLIEFVPEVGTLIAELNDLLAAGTPAETEAVASGLSGASAAIFRLLPATIQDQLLLDRDPHGNVQVSKIETESLLADMVATELASRAAAGKYNGKFSVQRHFFGYEGRCLLPSVFDATYCYSLGYGAGALISAGLTGYMACVQGLTRPSSEWTVGGVPLTMMMNLEKRQGKKKPVIRKALVELDSSLFKVFAAVRDRWAIEDHYRSPGPVQYSGVASRNITFTLKSTARTLTLEDLYEDGRVPPVGSGNDPRDRAAFMSDLERFVRSLPVESPEILSGSFRVRESEHPLMMCGDRELVRRHFPKTHESLVVEVAPSFVPFAPADVGRAHRIGVVFCGRQTSGGHNIVAGVYDMVRRVSPSATVLGFVDGNTGLASGTAITLTDAIVDQFRNQGGFVMLGRDADSVSIAASADVCERLALTGLVLIGSPNTATDAGLLTEELLKRGTKTSVIAVPAGMDGDFRSPYVEATVGFESSSRVMAQLIANISIDANSAKKYWYFIRLMGRLPSYAVLECALQTHPNVVLVGEEIAAKRQSLGELVNYVADCVVARAKAGKNFGVLVMPEGLVSFIPELALLLEDIDRVLPEAEREVGRTRKLVDCVESKLSAWGRALYASLPASFRAELVVERGTNRSVNLSQIQSERLLAEMVGNELRMRKRAGTYKGAFSSITHYIGYQGRSAQPTLFDCQLAYALGQASAAFIAAGHTGLLATARNLTMPVAKWQLCGVPLHAICTVARDGDLRVQPQNVSLRSPLFQAVDAQRATWLAEERYSSPGGAQFSGTLAGLRNMSLAVELGSTQERLKDVRRLCEHVQWMCQNSVAQAESVDVAISSLDNLSRVLEVLQRAAKM